MGSPMTGSLYEESTMQILPCPSCQAELDPRSKEQSCGQCHAHLSVTALCPTCQQELERLKACGAVEKNPANAGFMLCALQ